MLSPSPGGDALCRNICNVYDIPVQSPSPGGDALCPLWSRCSSSSEMSPSPGGDALCRQFLIKKRKKKFDFLWE